MAKKFIERYARANNKTRIWQETERLIARNILPRWGTRPITSIEPRDVTELLDAVADRAPIAANRVLAAGRKMFNWAYDHHLIETSPFGRIKAPTKETSRDRKHADFELALIWQAAGQLGYPFGPFIQLAVLLGQRREEIAGMRWSELDSELTLWTLPRKRTKNGVQHQVPITPQARTILVGLPRLDSSDFVFTTTGNTSVSGFSKCKAKLDAVVADLNDGEPIMPWRLHDLRRTVASGMGRLGIRLEVIEKTLNHTSGSFAGIVGVYQQYAYLSEITEALERWGDHVVALDRDPEIVGVPLEMEVMAE